MIGRNFRASQHAPHSCRRSSKRYASAALSLFWVMPWIGCAEGPPPRIRELVSGSFANHFELVRKITLEQNDSVIIARVSGMDMDSEGRILLADASEANVKLYSRDGRLIRVFGRAGKGPGEFAQPRFPRFGSDGLIHVGDGQATLVHVFREDGTFVRTTPLFQFSPVMGLDLLSTGEYILTAGFHKTHTLFVVDTSGTLVKALLRRDRLRATTEPKAPVWRPVTQYWMAVQGDEVVVTTTVSDSLWRVQLETGDVQAIHLSFAGYIQPALPDKAPRSGPDLLAWYKSFHIAAAVFTGTSTVTVPFVQGVLNYGDPMILAHRSTSGQWLALHGAPPPVFANDSVYIALLTPDDDAVTLGLFRPRTMN